LMFKASAGISAGQCSTSFIFDCLSLPPIIRVAMACVPVYNKVTVSSYLRDV
jgi:hypothetical protein